MIYKSSDIEIGACFHSPNLDQEHYYQQKEDYVIHLNETVHLINQLPKEHIANMLNDGREAALITIPEFTAVMNRILDSMGFNPLKAVETMFPELIDNSETFRVSETAQVVVTSYELFNSLDGKPHVLSVSVEGKDSDGEEIEYLIRTYYPDTVNRNADFFDFDQKRAEKIFSRAVKAINA